MRGSRLCDDRLDLVAFELTHGETFTSAATAFNIQAAKVAKKGNFAAEIAEDAEQGRRAPLPALARRARPAGGPVAEARGGHPAVAVGRA